MDTNANSSVSGATDTSSVTAIKVQVVLDTTTEQLKKQFSGIQTDIEKDPIGLTFGVDKKTSKDAIIKGLQEILGNGTNITIGAGVDPNAGNQVKKQIQNIADDGQQVADKSAVNIGIRVDSNAEDDTKEQVHDVVKTSQQYAKKEKINVIVDTKTKNASRKLNSFLKDTKEKISLDKISTNFDLPNNIRNKFNEYKKKISGIKDDVINLRKGFEQSIPKFDYSKIQNYVEGIKFPDIVSKIKKIFGEIKIPNIENNIIGKIKSSNITNKFADLSGVKAKIKDSFERAKVAGLRELDKFEKTTSNFVDKNIKSAFSTKNTVFQFDGLSKNSKKAAKDIDGVTDSLKNLEKQQNSLSISLEKDAKSIDTGSVEKVVVNNKDIYNSSKELMEDKASDKLEEFYKGISNDEQFTDLVLMLNRRGRPDELDQQKYIDDLNKNVTDKISFIKKRVEENGYLSQYDLGSLNEIYKSCKEAQISAPNANLTALGESVSQINELISTFKIEEKTQSQKDDEAYDKLISILDSREKDSDRNKQIKNHEQSNKSTDLDVFRENKNVPKTIPENNIGFNEKVQVKEEQNLLRAVHEVNQEKKESLEIEKSLVAEKKESVNAEKQKIEFQKKENTTEKQSVKEETKVDPYIPITPKEKLDEFYKNQRKAGTLEQASLILANKNADSEELKAVSDQLKRAKSVASALRDELADLLPDDEIHKLTKFDQELEDNLVRIKGRIADQNIAKTQSEANAKLSAQVKYGISQFNDEMTKYGKLRMDQLALSYKNGGSSKELTAVDSLENESRESLEKLKDYLAGILPQDQLDAVLQRYDNFERELSDKLYRAKQHYEDLKNARESANATAEEKRQAKQTDTYTDDLATARNKYKNMSGVPADVSGALDNVDNQIKKLDTLKVGTEDYANQLNVIGTAWADATRQMSAFDEAQKKTENHVKSMTEQALKWKDSIKNSETASQELKDSIDSIIDASKKLDSDHNSDAYKQGVKDLDDAFITAKASMSVYTDGYKDLESTARRTLTEIRKVQLELKQAGNSTFDQILSGDGDAAYIDGSFESQFNYLKTLNSQSAEYKTVLNGIVEEWRKTKLEIQQALKSEEDLAKEAAQRQNQIRSQQKAYNNIMKTLGTADFTGKDSRTKAFFEKIIGGDTKRTGAQAVAELRSEMAKLSETQPPAEYEQTLKNIKDLVIEINKRIGEARNYSGIIKADNTNNNHMQDLLRELYSYREKLIGLEKKQGLLGKYEELFNAIKTDSISFDEAQLKVSAFKNACHSAGLETETLGQKLSRLFKEHFQTAIAMAGVAMVKQGLREVYNNVVDIDTSMTNLRKVTNETESAYSSFLSSASSQARELGASISDVIDSTAEWSRLGYTLDESQELAKWSTVLSNIGDGIDSASDAASYLVSILKGFRMEADEVEHVVNVLNSVGNNEPISESGIAEALVRSASALSAAGNTFEESVALITSANSVLQDPDTVGKVYADVA